MYVHPRRSRERRGRDALGEPLRRDGGRLEPGPLAVIFADTYTLGDSILYEPDGAGGRRISVRNAARGAGSKATEYPLSGIRSAHYPPSGRGLLLASSLFDDAGLPATSTSSGRARSSRSRSRARGTKGMGELEGLVHLDEDRYAVQYNIDGCSWAYEARFDEAGRRLTVERVLVGEGDLADGVAPRPALRRASGRFALSFCTATMPTQLYVLDADGGPPRARPSERPLGHRARAARGRARTPRSSRTTACACPPVSTCPSPELGYEGPRPLVYYVHGGPQSQERPNFAWFSMPLIQILTLEGFAVFVPNARGSTGYGLTTRSASTATGAARTGSTTSTP